MENTWPGSKKHAMTQNAHESWNRENYPGTLQICTICGAPTGFCEEDGIRAEDGEPLCDNCAWEHIPRDC